MNHQGLRWNVHCVANVGQRIRLNLYKRGFKIYDLLVFLRWQFMICGTNRKSKKTGAKAQAYNHIVRSIALLERLY